MERLIWKHQSSEPFYVFDEKHVIHFWDDGISIHRTASWYKDLDTRLTPLEPPHIYPKALPIEFYKGAILNERLPVSVAIEGGSLGSVKLTSGDAAGSAATAIIKERIVEQQTRLSLADDCLVLDLKVAATPVDPTAGRGHRPDRDDSLQTYAFQFRFPLDIVPELLNLTASERRVFDRNRKQGS